MKGIEKMIGIACDGMEDIASNGKFRTAQEIDTAYKLMGIVKRGMCVMEMEEDGASYDMDDRSYRGGSYARGRSNARRDSMGRYSRADGGSRSYGRDEYSRHGKEEFVERLHGLMDKAPDEQTRTAMQDMIERVR